MAAPTATAPETVMWAVVHDRYGSPELLRFQEIARPHVKEGEVLIRVRAAGVNVRDSLIVQGRPYLARPAYGGFRHPKHEVPGVDVAGEVVAVGNNCTRLRPGDEVFGWCEGAFAEFVSGAEGRLALKPPRLTFEQAAAVPVAACTALKNLRDAGHVQPGQKVLINGAAGGVGTFAVQIAKWLGAEVTGVCSTRNVELVRSIGADHVIDYTVRNFTQTGQRYDLVLDNVMNHPVGECLRSLTSEGLLILNNGTSGGRFAGTLGRMAGAMLVSRFVRQRIRLAARGMPTTEDLATLRELIDAGKLVPVIDRTYPLSETSEALRYLGEGHARGKVVIVP